MSGAAHGDTGMSFTHITKLTAVNNGGTGIASEDTTSGVSLSATRITMSAIMAKHAATVTKVDNYNEGGTPVSPNSACKAVLRSTSFVTTGGVVSSVDGTSIFVAMAIMVTEGSCITERGYVSPGDG